MAELRFLDGRRTLFGIKDGSDPARIIWAESDAGNWDLNRRRSGML